MEDDAETENCINQASNILIQALRDETSTQDEIFCILMHLSPFLGKYLPFDSELSPAGSLGSQSSIRRGKNEQALAQKYQTLENIRYLTWTLANYYSLRIKDVFSGSIRSDNEQPHLLNSPTKSFLTLCIQRIQVLIGDKQAEEKFRSAVSWHMDHLREHRLSTDLNPLTNLSQTKSDFICVATDAKSLIKDILPSLMCGKVFKEKQHVLEFIQDTVLEKLSNGLLSLSDSVGSLNSPGNKPKPSATSNKRAEEFSSAVNSDETHFPTQLLADFSEVVEIFLKLEAFLKSSDTMQVLDYSTGSKNKKGVLKPHPFNLPDLVQSSHRISLNKLSSSARCWNWHECIKDIVPLLSAGIAQCVQEVTQTSLEEAKEKYKSLLELESAPAASRKLPGTAHPLESIKCVSMTLNCVVHLLPLAILGGHNKQMTKLQSDFLDVVNQSLKNFKQFLTTLTDDVPEKASPENLTTILATACDIVSVVHHCAVKMHHDNRLPFHGSLHLYKSLCNQMLQLLIQYHKSKLCTQILHDPDSHHWSDPRAFYEGERCLYAIEMWHLYIRDLTVDLKSKLPSGMVREILCDIVGESLSVLSDRYCNCKPSHNRSKQIWQDVQSVLLCFYDIMWEIVDKPTKLCPAISHYPEKGNENLIKIHSSLSDMFVCGIVLSAPTEELHDVLRQLDAEDFGKMNTMEWLSYLNPTMFQADWNGMMSSLSDQAEILLCLKHSTLQKDMWIPHMLHVLTMRNYLLAMNLVTGKVCLPSVNLTKIQSNVLGALIASDILPQVMMAAIQATPAFSNATFLNLEFLNCSANTKLQPWQVIVKQIVMPLIFDALSSVVGFLSSHAWSAMTQTVIDKLPANFRSMIPNADIKDKECLKHISLCLTLKALRAKAYSMPTNLIQFFRQVDSFLGASSSQVQCDSYWCHVLLYASRAALLNFQYWQQSLGIDVESVMGADLLDLSGLLVGINQFQEMINIKYTVAGICVSDVITSFQQTLVNISDQTADLSNEPHQHDVIEHDLSTDEIRCLQFLFELLFKNTSTIAEQWNVKLIPVNFVADPGLGSYLDHKSIAEVKPDWEELLIQCFMSVNADIIKTLMKHRADMQTNAHLTDQERDWVQFIKQSFLNASKPV
uniref:Uncharacterized protein KIAA0825-like n=1 Tax=Phallusia mammillata TaxID=59560 RepID=A0A6F9DFX8_9ASCI|nr:uncharacterized protein KIAA0825-like [Phallusia mammillata]